MKLSDLKIGESAYLLQVNGEEAFARRLSEIGFIRGEKIHNHMKAPLMDPVEYEIMGTTVSLRRSETKYIDISLEPVEKDICPESYKVIVEEEGSIDGNTYYNTNNKNNNYDNNNNNNNNNNRNNNKKCNYYGEEEGITYPNNKSNQNIEKKRKNSDSEIELVTEEEMDETTPSFCKFCPEKDECENKKSSFFSNLRFRKWNGQEIKVALVGNPNCGKTTLFNHISGGHEKEGNYCGVTVDSKEGTFIHNGVKVYLIDLPGTYSLASYSPEEKYVEDFLKNTKINVILNVLDSNNLERNLYLTLQCQKAGVPMVGALNMYDELEKRGDSIDHQELSNRLKMNFFPTTSKYGKGLTQLFDEVLDAKGTIPKFKKQAEIIDTNNTGECYAYINQALEGIYNRKKSGKSMITSRIDTIVTNRWLGFIIFALIIFIIFGFTFDWCGNFITDLIQLFFDWLSETIGNHMGDGWLKDLICDGIIGGVGGVMVFLPNILILFICVSLMEESGYMARAAFILDRIMRVFGLHGKSFIPMICGFGCNVPAIMSTRGIENRKNRLVTILICSLFSCSARIPVYTVLANAFFPNRVTPIIFSVYLVGIAIALVLAKIFSVFLVKEQEMNYLMELPEYRLPSLFNVLKHAWERGKQYLMKMGTIILMASILIWVVSYFPHHETDEGRLKTDETFIGIVGKFIEPVFRPQGFNWQMDVGLISGLSAKELVVTTLNIVYGGEADAEIDQQTNNLSKKLKDSGALNANGAYAYMLFNLLYFPCMATIATIGHEAGWKWAGFSICYTCALAWVVSAVFYQVSRLF